MMNVRHQDGFTMIELIVYLGIASIALLVFYGFAANVMQSAARIKSASDVQENAHVVLSRITHDVRTTDAAVASGSTLTFTKTIGGIPTTTCYDLVSTVVEYGSCTGAGCACAVSAALSDNTVNVTTLSFTGSSAQIGVNVTVEPRVGNADSVALSTTIVPRSSLYQ